MLRISYPPSHFPRPVASELKNWFKSNKERLIKKLLCLHLDFCHTLTHLFNKHIVNTDLSRHCTNLALILMEPKDFYKGWEHSFADR